MENVIYFLSLKLICFQFHPFFTFIFHSYLQIACTPGLDDNNISSLHIDHLRIKRQIPIYFSRKRVVLIFSSIKFEATQKYKATGFGF